MRSRAAVAIVALALIVLVACEPKPPDYQSILATSTRDEQRRPDDRASRSRSSQYLESIGVTGAAGAAGRADRPDRVDPDAAGLVAGRQQPEAAAAHRDHLARAANIPTAMLVVFKLHGDFDAAEAIKHGNADAQSFENFKQLDASTADFNGFPSSMIQGSYDLGASGCTATTGSSSPPAGAGQSALPGSALGHQPGRSGRRAGRRHRGDHPRASSSPRHVKPYVEPAASSISALIRLIGHD